MISEVARPAFETALSRRETITKAFEMTGIFPFNPAAVDQRKLKAGEIFQHNQNTSEETVVLRESVVSVAQASAPPEDSVLLASGEEEGAVVDLATDPASDQFEADMEEAVVRSLMDKSRQSETDILSQPGCSHWSAPLTSQVAAAPVTEAGGGSDLNFREDSLSVKKQKLQRYETIMLEPEQIAHFEDLFKKGRRFDVKNYLWLSWLPLKLAAVGNEQEAFDFVLQERTPANVPKRTTKRKVSQPTGAARINPQSEEYKTIFRERIESEKRKEETKKANLKGNRSGRC